MPTLPGTTGSRGRVSRVAESYRRSVTGPAYRPSDGLPRGVISHQEMIFLPLATEFTYPEAVIRRLFPVGGLLTGLLASALLASVLVSPTAHAATYPTPTISRWEPNATIKAGRTKQAWRSPWVAAKDGRALLPSWNVSRMPDGTWLKVWVRFRSGTTTTKWKTIAMWRHGLAGGKRTTYGKQTDSLVWVDTDTVKTRAGRTFSSWQVQVGLYRKNTKLKSPVLSGVAGVASTYTTKSAATSKTTMTSTVDLAVPAYSQMLHSGHFPQYGGGGQAWCSPTSTAMVLRYYGLGPVAKNYTWAKGADPWVDHAARYTYDSKYRGTGTWPFNTAYASRYGTEAVVHRLPNLRAVEAFVKQGVPVVVSVAFGRGQLSGAPITSTPGHLIVVRGFTSTGAVIVNDPAGRTNGAVKRTYDRAQFERAWLRGSGGVAYVIAPTAKGLTF